MDGSPVASGNPSSGTLYSTSLSDDLHTVVLSPQPTSVGQGLNFTGAKLISPASSECARFALPFFSLLQSDSHPRPSQTFIDNQDSTTMIYHGSWFNNTNAQIPNATDPQQYFQTNQSGASASVNFRGRAVSVNGECNNGFGVYQVVMQFFLELFSHPF